MVSRILNSVFPGLRTQNTTDICSTFNELTQHQPKIPLVKKIGYVSRKRRDRLTVVVDDEAVDISLDDVVGTFKPEKFDRITLLCEMDENSNEISTVRRFELPRCVSISGEITSLEAGVDGVIDKIYYFSWDAISNDQIVLKKGDRVKAECIQCEKIDDTVYEWRCLTVTDDDHPLEQPLVSHTNGIEIVGDVIVKFNGIHDEPKYVTMKVKNTCKDEECGVEYSRFVGNKSASQLILVYPTRNASFVLKPGDVKEYRLKATPRLFGNACEQFAIAFNKASTGKFHVTRFIEVCVNDPEHRHKLIGTGQNVHGNLRYTYEVSTIRDRLDIISGEPTSAPNFVATRFDNWLVPSSLRDIVLKIASTRTLIFDALAEKCPYLNESLDVENYSHKFHDLLHMEECSMEHSFRKYDCQSYFKREKEYLALAVDNVADNRPKIVIGDYIIATDPRSNTKAKAIGRKGTIYDVKQNRILLKFDDSFHANYQNEDFLLTFHFSRRSLQKQHHAIELALRRVPSILFPNDAIREIVKQIDVTLNDGELMLECNGNSTLLPWFNPSLNIVQKQAVTNILQGIARPLPYVIFGPPGTGKTITLIETILQIMKNLPHSRIMVATPSNSAANLITKRIIQSGILNQSNHFVRLVSHNNVRCDMIPQTIIRHCATIDIALDNTTEDGYKLLESGLQMNCNATRLKAFRMLIGTCMTLGTLMQCDFPEDHFTHVIVDESGQCMETEMIIPLSFVDRNIGQVILAGDPMQLGPIVLSHFAKNLGLGTSFLCRLLERSPYKPNPMKFECRYDPRIVTRLTNNYRSLPSIMRVYNERFYDNDLRPMVNETDSVEVKRLRKLEPILPRNATRNASDGVIFFGVQGKNERCSESPSWYNEAEADTLVTFYKKLLRLGETKDDIGIITPYTQQVKKIRAKIKSEEIDEPKIGTVEEFQGQERQIILLSTVRSAERELLIDQRFSLGFIKHPNRMNVAISRARALLVVFGSPKLLSLDDNWKWLIAHCKKNGSVFGDV